MELETFAQAEIHRLEDLRLAALEDRIAADLEAGADAQLVAEIEALVRVHPLRERLRSQLMLALYRSGRQAEALSAYHEARRTLVEELGIEPGPELQALYGSILRQERSLVRVAPPALEDHYDEVIRAFSAGRLVPVLGPGVGGVAGDELAMLLAERFELGDGARGLAYISQAVAARNGIGPLHDELHLALDRDFEPSSLHAWLAGLPPLLRHRQLPQQLIVSTSFDTGVERAFDAAGEELDIVIYVAAGRDRGKFLHILPSGEARVVEEPNAYTGLALDERSVLLEDPRPRRPRRDAESARASPSARTTTSTTWQASRQPGPCRCSSRRGCAGAISSSSATPSTTGACASSCGGCGVTTASRTAPGRCSPPRRRSRASCGASAGSRRTTRGWRVTRSSWRG